MNLFALALGQKYTGKPVQSVLHLYWTRRKAISEMTMPICVGALLNLESKWIPLMV
jgi:hypothetical protein